MKYLVIVESPSKCKKIEKYLNDNDDINIYEVVATMGHITELKNLKNIDMNTFICNYELIEAKKKNTEAIRKKIKTVDEVILSCDLDREGEGICAAICQVFNLDIEKTKRITFNEITETAILNAIKNPRSVDMNLVHAQQTRQILDLIVGYKISPMLWKLISKNKDNSLSAGRCQTPALKIIYENQQEINSNEEKKVYNTVGYFTNSNIVFDLTPAGKYETEDEMTGFLEGTTNFTHIYTCTKPTKVIKKQPEPFTTSTIQQAASNDYHYSPKETMKICQLLYEGGFITYMRTDSKTYSNEFIETAKDYIKRNYDETYVRENIEQLISGYDNKNTEEEKINISKKTVNKTKTKTKTISNIKVKQQFNQEAHEAIRPTNISLCEIPETNISFGSKERKMYKMIWENTLESCMSSASYHSVTANITAFQNTTFTHTSELIDFPGWKIVKKKYTKENKEYQYLQTIKQNSCIPYKKIVSKVTIKGQKQHYTEARLVQLLEERGIGRPSTFSSLVEKIQERGYVKKADIKGKEILCKDYELENGDIFEIEAKREFGNEKNKLVIQQMGTIVFEFLDKHFNNLFNYEYTSNMEEKLDKISKGEIVWSDICKECNSQIDELLDRLKDETKLEIKIDENNTYIIGKYGPVIKCTENKDGNEQTIFKPVKKDLDIHDIENGECSVEDIVESNKKINVSQNIIGKHDGNDVIIKKGKFGLYIKWGEKTKTLKEFGNRPLENIKFEEIEKYLNEENKMVREINSNASIRKGNNGDYLFYKTSRMKKPKFLDIKNFAKETNEDYKKCNINILKSWVEEKYEIKI